MARVISVVNQKGGVGKTTTMVSVASILTEQYKLRVLAIDLDPQGNASSGLGLEKTSTENVFTTSLSMIVNLRMLFIQVH